MLKVQEYLRTKSLDSLKEEYGIRSRIQEYKISLNYSQIESPTGNPLVDECRGLILRRTTQEPITENSPLGDTKILALGFKRFYNLGQECASSINWNAASIQEKIDGTLILLHFDDVANKWCVATRSVPEADIIIESYNFTFRSLFENALNARDTSIDKLFSQGYIEPGMTYVFELVSPYNRIVVEYDRTDTFLLGIRNNLNLEERNIYDADACRINSIIPTPRRYDLNSIEQIIAFVNDQDPTKQEGVVVVDDSFNRIKIKSLSYVAFNKARDKLGASYRNCLSIVLEEKVDDFIGKLPKEIEDIILDMQEKVKILIKNLEFDFEKAKKASLKDGEIDMKIFASFAKESAWPAPLFAVARKIQPNIKTAICNKHKSKNKYSNNSLDNMLRLIEY